MSPPLTNDAAGRNSAMRSSYDRRFSTVQLLMEDLAKACSQKGIEPVDAFQIALVDNIVSSKFLDSRGSSDSRQPKRMWKTIHAIALLKGLLLQVAVLVGGFLQGQVSFRLSKAPHEKEIFILKDVADTTTVAAVRYINGCETPPRQFLNLTPGVAACLPSWRRSRILPNAAPLRPARICDWLKAVTTYIRHSSFLFRWLRSPMVRNVIALEPAQLSLLFGHIARGSLYWHWGLAQSRAGECYVCTHLQMDAAYLDAALRKRGATTVHWLHGTAEYRYKFFGASSVAVTPTLADADILGEYSKYQRVVSVPRDPARKPVYRQGGAGSLLLLTNLLHTHHQAPLVFREASLRQLLDAVSRTGRLVIWRPHPSERRSPLFLEIARGLDPAVCRVECEGSLDEQIANCGMAVSTFSGAIADVVKAGRVPLIWEDLRYELHGLWDRIPSEILFSDFSSLTQVISRMESASFTSLHSKMWDTFNCGAAQPPSPGFFRSLMPEMNGNTI